ncbi:hypothetical protein V6N12_009806 [Hibiscus sabdariffa]|uniref:Uncharacterized protein n=1 Tax=Hibiscus sabdariffa TaxID=183260 RepID=A0ABR2EDJ7_9ROSI
MFDLLWQPNLAHDLSLTDGPLDPDPFHHWYCYQSKLRPSRCKLSSQARPVHITLRIQMISIRYPRLEDSQSSLRLSHRHSFVWGYELANAHHYFACQHHPAE